MPPNAPAAEPESSPTARSQELSTPELIEQALARREITAEQRLLYLAYAVYEHESLPVQFRSNAGWRGTSIVKEIKEAADSPSVMCTLSPHVQSELRRLLDGGVMCDN